VDDVAFESVDDRTRRTDGARFEAAAETTRHLLCRLYGTRVVSVYVYGVRTECACGETDVCREAFVALRAVPEAQYFGSFHVRSSAGGGLALLVLTHTATKGFG
jgi:hypothetical protein